jgi:SPP1 family predicted phage head-tail adaptor
MTPTIGELRRRVRIEAPVDAPDGAGGRARSWITVATVFAAIRPVRSRDGLADGRSAGIVTHEITIRRRDVRRARLVEGTVRYRVLAVEDTDPARRFVTCLCEEEQA